MKWMIRGVRKRFKSRLRWQGGGHCPELDADVRLLRLRRSGVHFPPHPQGQGRLLGHRDWDGQKAILFGMRRYY